MEIEDVMTGYQMSMEIIKKSKEISRKWFEFS